MTKRIYGQITKAKDVQLAFLSALDGTFADINTTRGIIETQ